MEVSKTLFLIDDDQDDREIFEEALKAVDSSIRFICVPDAKRALQKLTLELFLPDFIFLDLNMPGITGKQCLAELKKMEHLKLTPIIVYTTSHNPKDIEEVKRLGASHFLTKPNTIKDLRIALEILLKKDWPEIV